MARNLRIRPGDAVTNKQVASYALPGHKDCNGSGFVRRDLEILCDCARARFLDQNMFRIFPDADGDRLIWGPNPPTSSELKEAARRSGAGWAQFQELVKPKKVPDAV